MTPGKLLTQLQKNYQVVCFEDLADINQVHSAVYKIFQRHHKTYFEANERIVFYSEHLPSNKLLQHIQNAANLIDISSCFIMICGPYDLAHQLRALSCDEIAIEYYPVEVSSKSLEVDDLYEENTLCPLPWMHLAVMNLGQCTPCCVSTQTVGFVDKNSLTDVFLNQDMDSLRRSMLAGKQPDGCSHCWNLEAKQLSSHRQWNMEFYKKKFYTEWLDAPAIRSIDFRPSNVCNFKCRICNPAASSLFAAEQAQIYKKTKTLQINDITVQGRWYDNNREFVDEIIKLLPSLETIEFYGGEPFLLKQLPKFLEQAVNSGFAKNIKLHFNTNVSVFPESLLDYFKKFRQVNICASIDNIGSRFEFERGGTWAEVEKNLQKFQSCSYIEFSIIPTINIQNILYLQDIIDWAQTNNYKIIWSYLDTPEYLNIDYMTDKAKKLVISKFQSSSHPELKLICNRINSSAGSDGKKFVDYMKTLDNHRNQNFLISHYEIANAMGYVV
jgi:organic radical activating enzyme